MKKNKNRQQIFKTKFFLGFVLLALGPAFYLSAPKLFSVSYQSGDLNNFIEEAKVGNTLLSASEDEVYLKTPVPLKSIYMTSCVASTPSFRNNLLDFLETTELNSVIIDIKDFSGTLSFKPEDQKLLHAWEAARCGTLEMKDFIKELHSKNIYTIGRITVFQDPHMANLRSDLAVQKRSDGSIWKDFKGLSFTDPGSKEIWDYHIDISKEARKIGFDELNFDYIRFPSDGPMKDIKFPISGERSKPEVLEDFFEYLDGALKDTGVILSADLFGMTTTNTDDLNIGQVLERAMPYFDYIAPMVYPSHYPSNWNNFANPNHYPYEVINISMKEAVRRATSATTPVKTKYNKPIMNKVAEFDSERQATTTREVFSGLYDKPVYDANIMRPWLQDFRYGGEYGPDAIKAQIQATYDAGLHSWMFWDPANRYESLREVLKQGLP